MADDNGRPLTTADLAKDAEPRPPHTDALGDRVVSDEQVRVIPSRDATRLPVSTPGVQHERPADTTDQPAALFPGAEVRKLHAQWTEIQAGFVDMPRDAVQRADALVAEAMKRLADVFATERANLERQWDRGENVTTEDLRVALQRYRAFFDRLLAI